MNVVHLVQDPGVRPGAEKGAAVHVRAMCDAFRDVGARVRTLHTCDPQAIEGALRGPFEGHAELLYERYTLGAVAGAEAARAHGVAHVLEVNAPLEDEILQHRPDAMPRWDRASEERMFRDAALVLCVSEEVEQYVLARGARRELTVVAGNGVDPALFRPRPEAEAERARLYPDLKRPFVVGFHGRVRPWHGLGRIAAACGLALEQGVDLAVHCVGRGPFEEAFGGLLPPERLHIEAWLDSERLALAVSTFDALPLGYGADEPCYFSPLKLREAMAAGVVPIVPNVGELPAAVAHGDAGVLYPAGDTFELAAALGRLAAQPQRARALAKAAREEACQYSWEAIARMVLERVAGGVA